MLETSFPSVTGTDRRLHCVAFSPAHPQRYKGLGPDQTPSSLIAV